MGTLRAKVKQNNSISATCWRPDKRVSWVRVQSEQGDNAINERLVIFFIFLPFVTHLCIFVHNGAGMGGGKNADG